MVVEDPGFTAGDVEGSGLVVEGTADVATGAGVASALTAVVGVLADGNRSMSDANENEENDYEGSGNGGHGTRIDNGMVGSGIIFPHPPFYLQNPRGV